MIFADAKLADFPEKVHPMTVKELRQGLRARSFVIPFIGMHLVMIAACLIEYFAIVIPAAEGGGLGSDQTALVRYGLMFWGVAYFMLIFVIPATRFFDLQQEFGGRNAELLLLSGLSRWQIVGGKWVFSVALSSLIFVSILPYLLLRYFFGQFELIEHVIIAFGLLMANAAFCAMVIGASAYKNYLGRIVLILAASGVLAIIMGIPIGVAISSLNDPTEGWFFPTISCVNMVSAGAFFSILGLQLARVKLRTFEDPYDPAPGSLVVILYLFAPLLIGVPGIALGIGSVVAAAFFAWIALNIDPPPKKGKKAYYAQN